MSELKLNKEEAKGLGIMFLVLLVGMGLLGVAYGIDQLFGIRIYWLPFVALIVGIVGWLWYRAAGRRRHKRHEVERINAIEAHLDEWGRDTCRSLLQRRIVEGMTIEMVRASLGEPNQIDRRQDAAADSDQVRWIYSDPGRWNGGTARRRPSYVWFRDGRVTQVEW